MQALPRPLRSKMSLAGKMLHSIHMRTWGEIAKRRSQLKEMDSWRCTTQMCNWRAQSDKGSKGSGAGQHGQDNSTQTQKQQKHCIIWRVSSFAASFLTHFRNPGVHCWRASPVRWGFIWVHCPNLLLNISHLRLQEGHCAEFTVEVDIMRLILGRWDELWVCDRNENTKQCLVVNLVHGFERCGGKRLQELQERWWHSENPLLQWCMSLLD